MVDPWLLASDTLSDAVFLALPAVLWMFLFLFAWESPTEARDAGFGRRSFWLLLPGCLAGSLANLPFFGWSGSVLAVNIGGALIPLALSLYLPGRWLGGERRAVLVRTMAILAVLTGVIFFLLLLPTAPLSTAALGSFAGLSVPRTPLPGPGVPPVALALAGAVAAVLAAGAVFDLEAPERGRAGFGPASGFLLLASISLLLTFATTEAVANVGILSFFPYYLFAPILVGALAVAFSRPLFDLPRIAGIPFGYGAATLGVTVGADVLHESPLYGHGAGLLSIGGAGVLDLVYLSGLLAAGTGFVVLRAFPREGPHRAEPDPVPTPPGAFREAARCAARGDGTGAVAGSLRAADIGAAQARAAQGLPAAPPGTDPWAGVAVARWVAIDHANLRSLARPDAKSPYAVERALLASRLLVQIAGEVVARRLASARQRVIAFLIDLLFLSAPAVAIWGLLALTLPGNESSIAAGVPYNAALFAYPALGFLYFFGMEAATGTTVGKRILRLEVRTRELQRPGAFALLLRNVTHLVPLTILAELAGTAVLVALAPSSGGALPGVLGTGAGALLLLLLAVAGVAVVGAVSLLAINLSPERERIGDLWAGTWVVRRLSGGASAPTPGAGGAAPPASARSARVGW